MAGDNRLFRPVGVAMASSLGIVNPKKRREIDGVSGSSMVDLKATLFQAEEHAKHARTAGVAAPRSKLVVKAVAVAVISAMLGRSVNVRYWESPLIAWAM